MKKVAIYTPQYRRVARATQMRTLLQHVRPMEATPPSGSSKGGQMTAALSNLIVIHRVLRVTAAYDR